MNLVFPILIVLDVSNSILLQIDILFSYSHNVESRYSSHFCFVSFIHIQRVES